MLKFFFPYRIIDDPENDNISLVKFVRGQYKGFIIRFGMVRFNEKPRYDRKLAFNFQYDVVESPEKITYDSLQLKHYLSKFLIKMLDDHFSGRNNIKGNPLNFSETMQELF